jgi:hypothetical protein
MESSENQHRLSITFLLLLANYNKCQFQYIGFWLLKHVSVGSGANIAIKSINFIMGVGWLDSCRKEMVPHPTVLFNTDIDIKHTWKSVSAGSTTSFAIHNGTVGGVGL